MFARFITPIGLMALSIALFAAAAPSPAIAQQNDDLTFPIDAQQRQANWDMVTAEVSKADRNIAGLAQDVRNLLRTQDIVDPYMAGYGMSSADLGDVLALAYFSAVMLADGGKTDDPTKAQIDGIRARIAQSSTADFSSLSDAQKQQTADNLLYLVILQNAVAEGLAGQPALNDWMAAFAKTNSEMLGFDVTQVRMGADGFDLTDTASGTGQAATRAGQSRSIAALASGPASANAAAQSATMGNGTGDILGVDFDNTLVFMPGFNAGSLQSVNTLTVLLKDGRACQDCLDDVLKGDIAATAARDAGDVGRWRKAGNSYLVTFDDGATREIEAGDLTGPAPAGTKLSGKYEGVSGTSVGLANSLTIEFLNFRPDGTFSADGETSVVGAYASAYVDRAEKTGRYEVDGYRIIFNYANGKREEASLVMYSNKEELLIIDEVPHFIPDD